MRKILAAMLFISLSLISSAQSGITDSLVYAQSFENAVNQYHQARGQYLQLYNGISYINYPNAIIGYAFYDVPDWKRGTIVYNNVVYNNVQFKYDQVKDLLIVRHPDDYTMVTLYSPRVNAFRFPDASFVYLDSVANPSLPRSGFYQQLYNGPLGIIAKRTKVIEETIINRELEKKFVSKDFYYALKDGIYHRITNEKSVYKLIKGDAEPIKKYLRKNHIRFRKQKALALTMIAALYQQQNTREK